MAIQISENKEDTFLQLEKKVDLPEDQTHAFVVRFWLEHREIKGVKSLWRGVIEHVLSGRKKYLNKFDEVADFISSYLKG
jgi:hypothetical protein